MCELWTDSNTTLVKVKLRSLPPLLRCILFKYNTC